MALFVNSLFPFSSKKTPLREGRGAAALQSKQACKFPHIHKGLYFVCQLYNLLAGGAGKLSEGIELIPEFIHDAILSKIHVAV